MNVCGYCGGRSLSFGLWLKFRILTTGYTHTHTHTHIYIYIYIYIFTYISICINLYLYLVGKARGEGGGSEHRAWHLSKHGGVLSEYGGDGGATEDWLAEDQLC